MKKVLLLILSFCCFFASDITSTDYGKIIFEDGCYIDNSVIDIDGNGENENMSQEANQIIVKTLFDYEPFYNQKEVIAEDASYEEVEEYKTRYRANAKKYYSTLNKELLEKAKLTNYEDVYVSKYAPQIEYSYTISEFNANKNKILTSLAKDKDVSSVYVSNANIERVECLSTHLKYIGEQEIYNTGKYTGKNVVVGILDFGLVDTTNPNFVNTEIKTFRQRLTDTVGEHATQMACIIGGDGGLACEATILSAQLHGVMSNEVEWMIDNNVDVINMSYGNTLADGTYGSESAYADVMIKNYDITICASVGNTGQYTDGYVSNPAMGYNVLSVGSCYTGGSHSSSSSYLVGQSAPPKPVVCVPGDAVRVPTYALSISGTSVSCAIMTGSVAYLYEKTPSLKTDADKVLALVTCCSTISLFMLRDNGFDMLTGAGMFNFQNCLASSFKCSRYSNTSGTIRSEFYGGSVNMQANDTLKVSIASLINATGSIINYSFTDYDIKIYDSAHNLVAIRASSLSNVEILEFTATQAGKYYIYLYQASERINASDQICYAYRIYNESTKQIIK